MSEKSFVHVLPDENNLDLSSAFHLSYSRSSFLVDPPSIRPAQEPYVKAEYNNLIPISPQLSASLCHRTPQAGCWNSPLHTPTLSIGTECDEDEDEKDQIILLAYDKVGYCKQAIDLAPPASPRTNDSYTVSAVHNSNLTNSWRPDSPVPPEHFKRAEDDTMVQDQPSQYVDYLSYDWEEEDIWSSWKHIVSKREVYSDTARLENVLWRTWTKSQYRLRTVPPESLNWLKDCDVAWLYGPLQTSYDKLSTSSAGIGISESHSLLDKKPILKKRSLLEIMLQQPLSASLREQSPATNERRHIHFNDNVEQFAAVDVEDGDDDRDGIDSYAIDNDDSSSDDGLLMMKMSSKQTVLNQSNRNSSQASFSAESRTIAVLPPTTLKYREDAPELTKPKAKHGSGRISLSLSQEHSQRSKPTTKILLGSHNENVDVSWKLSRARANYKDGTSVAHDRLQLNASREISGNGGEAHGGLRRTPSRMGTLYGECDDDVVASGLFGRIVDTVNTAKDIAYILWNVGWR